MSFRHCVISTPRTPLHKKHGILKESQRLSSLFIKRNYIKKYKPSMKVDPFLNMKELDIKSGSSDDETDAETNTSLAEEVKSLYQPCVMIAEKQITSKKQYLLHIDATLESTPNVAAGLSNATCQVYNFSNNQFAKIADLSEHKDVISEVKFSCESRDLLYTSSLDGVIRLWDLRTPVKCSLEFMDTSKEKREKTKTITCFDISANRRLLAAGTDLCGTDAFILFWDIRKNELLGGYWQSHEDDITQVKFHPSDSNKLISGGDDMLVNIYDLTQTCEEDALVGTLNAGCSIEKIRWLDDQKDDAISLISHSSDVKLWKIEDVQPYFELHGNSLGEKMICDEIPYIVNVHQNDKNLFLLCGSNYSRGDDFRHMRIESKTVTPCGLFNENQQRVRASFYNPHTELLITGGEKGILNAWDLSSLKHEFQIKTD